MREWKLKLKHRVTTYSEAAEFKKLLQDVHLIKDLRENEEKYACYSIYGEKNIAIFLKLATDREKRLLGQKQTKGEHFLLKRM